MTHYKETRRTVLERSIYLLLTPIFLTFAMIACAGTILTGTPSFICPTPIPLPTSTVLAGTPLPTLVPPPTPYIISAPADFYAGDPIVIGDAVQFRLIQGEWFSAQGVMTWALEVTNIGTEDYEIFPALQMFASETNADSGAWGSSQEAGDLVDINVHNDVYTLSPNEVQIFNFATFVPAEVTRFTFQLDPSGADAESVLNWQNSTNPHCE